MRKLLTFCAALVCAAACTYLWQLWTDAELLKPGAEHPGPAARQTGGMQAPLASGEDYRRPLTPETSRPAQVTPTGKLTVADIADTALQLNAPQSTVVDDLEILQGLLAFYRRANGGVGPEGGLNEEILTSLRGENDMHLAVFPEKHPSLGHTGELLDRWGTPYYFHPISRGVMEIRSAGPDRKLWTDDDVTSGSPAEPNADGKLAGTQAEQ